MMNFKSVKQIKTITVFTGAFLIGMSLMAQSNDGIDALNSGMYQTAKKIFTKQLADSLSKPEACYYLGEAYRLSGNKDSAAFYFDLGAIGETPNSLCLIGKAGLSMAFDPDQSANLIKKARWVKEYYKNAALYIAIAKAYAENSNVGGAYEMLNLAKDLDKKNTNIYLTEGNILLQQNRPGEAAGKYETAIYFDSKCKPAYLKLALIYYKTRNYNLSLKYISNIREIDQSFYPAIKLFGDICYEQGKYTDALAAYSQYLSSPEAVINDRIRFAYSLFFNKEYQQSFDQITLLIPHFPTNQVLKRLLAYSLYEIGNYADGLSRMQAFINSADPSTIIASDYKYYARLLSKNNMDSISIINYLKAIEAGASPQEFYKEIAFVYEKMKKFSEAASYIEKHINTTKAPTGSDYFFWGKECYFAAGQLDSATIPKDSTQVSVRKALYNKADSIFGEMALKLPDNYLAFLWRARVNAILDPETEMGLAKPFYEKVSALLKITDKVNKKELVESYQYLGYYYYIKEDFQKSRTYWNNILEIDPTNDIALKAIEGMK